MSEATSGNVPLVRKNAWHWYLEAWRNYFKFKGRSSRAAFWYFTLWFYAPWIPVYFVDLDTAFDGSSFDGSLGLGVYFSLVALHMVAAIIPLVTVTVRRLHDTGRSGWWYWVHLVPFVGPVIITVLLVIDSQPGDNRYGPNPKGINLTETEQLELEAMSKKGFRWGAFFLWMSLGLGVLVWAVGIGLTVYYVFYFPPSP